MYINIENHLKYVRMDLDDGKPVEQLPVNGTLAVIDGQMNFRKPDGFIQFMKLVMDQIPATYGKQNPKWQEYLGKIYNMAEKLQEINTRFTGHTKEEFQAYCERVSDVMNTDTDPLDVLHLDIVTKDNLISFMEKHVENDNIKGFYYKPGEDYEQVDEVQKLLMNELMHQLSGIKFEKPSGYKKYDISSRLLLSGYHEHIHDALNIILSAAVYAINCSSTKKQDVYSFDTQKIHNELKYAEMIIERMKTVI